ncbi:MAG: HEPN domain-containing protein [Deltaproteobacteria bacterium]|jgi:HEPN domain-containing protein|nr:HEPN domain-containing protein [Deltaproteobacteria bacterium]
MNVFEEAQRWFVKADEDLRGAFVLFHDQLFDISCFHSQQGAEKALKGYLVCHGVIPPKTHDLGKLCQLASKLDSSFGTLVDSNLDLSSFAVFSQCQQLKVSYLSDMNKRIRSWPAN